MNDLSKREPRNHSPYFIWGAALTSLLVACSNTSLTNANDSGTSSMATGGASSASGGITSSGASNSGGGASSGGAPTSSGGSSNTGRDAGTSRDASSDAAPIVDGSTTRADANGGGCPSDSPPVVANADAAAGPVNPIPTNLWHPPPTFDEPSGTYVYLNSDNSDYIGGGQSFTYTQADAILKFESNYAHEWTVSVQSDTTWEGEFQTMNTVDRLAVGYYANLTALPSNPSVHGGIDWFGDGRACDNRDGWFVVDSVSYTCGVLTDVVLRFEQHCEDKAPALHGKIHWSAADKAKPPGPVVPPPASLWRPKAGSTPASGSFVYLQSETGDPIGDGKTLTYTPPSATLSLKTAGALATVSVTTTSDNWTGNFLAMNVLSELELGYYPNLERWPFNNPTRGGLDWSGDGSGCNTETGWFAVDSIAYSGADIQSIDLRFEQHCEGTVPALHGEVRIVAP